MLSNALLLSGSIGLTHVNQCSLDKIGHGHACQQPLPDLIHQMTPNMSKYEKCIDMLPIVVGVIVLYLSFVDGTYSDLLDMSRLLSIMYLLRIFTTRATILPSPICTKERAASAIGGCHDCVFSGHTATMLLMAYFVYKRRADWLWPLVGYSILSTLAIVVTRSHYTIDVVVAWITVYAIIKFFEK
jgi:hypothetical protein